MRIHIVLGLDFPQLTMGGGSGDLPSGPVQAQGSRIYRYTASPLHAELQGREQALIGRKSTESKPIGIHPHEWHAHRLSPLTGLPDSAAFAE